jgi:hypothetical protein
MTTILNAISRIYHSLIRHNLCEAFVNSQNPRNVYEVEKLIFKYINTKSS